MSLWSRFDPGRSVSAVVTAVALGVLAGPVGALYLTVTGEPEIRDAIAIEEANADPHADHEEPPVSRGVQQGVGLFGAYALTGGAFGLLFGATFVRMRFRQPDVFRRAIVAGTILATAITVSPWLKYPPNPPAVGDPATLADRQRLYAILIVLTLLILLGAAHLSGRMRAAGWVDDQRLLAIALLILGALSAVYAILPPPPDPVPVPASLIWRFRMASLSGNLLLWALLTVGFGVAAAHSERRNLGSPATVGQDLRTGMTAR